MEKSLQIQIELNLTSSNYARIKSQIKETLNNAKSAEIEEVVIDLDRTNFIDSTGISLIVSIVKRFGNKRVRVINCSSAQYEAFSISNLTKIIDIENPNKTRKENQPFLEIEDTNRKFLIRLQVNVGYSNIQEFKTELAETLGAHSNRTDQWDEFIIDLRNIDLIDSAAIGAFLGIYRRVNKTGKSFRVIGSNAFILDLIDKMDLNDHFGIEGAS